MPDGRICLGCGTLVVGMTAQRCAPCERADELHREEVRRAYRGRKAGPTQRGKARRALYDTPEWRAVRARVVQRDGACRMCGSTERLSVHHLTPAADDMAAALDMDNLVTLCRVCHGRVDGGKSARARQGSRRIAGQPPRIIGKGGRAR